MWKFDEKTASVFASHARQHIPNYEQVINQCIDLCKSYDKNSKIIDVGCAIGETLIALKNNGFTNLHGVDSSKAMLEKCDGKGFHLTLSDSFPNGLYDIVIMNWTLHFIKEKIKYITDIYHSLPVGGTMIITDKTNTDEIPLKYYHLYKSRMGVSDDDIITKANSVKDIMYINDVEWYLNSFKSIGFSKIYIMNAHWCFTSFVCIK